MDDRRVSIARYRLKTIARRHGSWHHGLQHGEEGVKRLGVADCVGTAERSRAKELVELNRVLQQLGGHACSRRIVLDTRLSN